MTHHGPTLQKIVGNETSNSRMGGKCDLGDCGMIVDAKTVLKLLISWGFHTQVSRVYSDWCNKEKISGERQFCGRKRLFDTRGQWRLARLVRADRNATVTQITSLYSCAMEDKKACVALQPEGTEILKHSRSAFCLVLGEKFGCTAEIHNVTNHTTSSFSHSKATIVPEIKYSKQLSNSLKLSVWKDDLTTHKADAVVNAANKYLHHGGGLALALSRAGGPKIQQCSDKIIKSNGRLQTGHVVVTPAGNLPCDIIIHAVGPSVSPNASEREINKASLLLQKAIWNILVKTNCTNLQSVAIPAISSGLYNFPRDRCANIIVSTVMLFNDQRNPNARSLEVRLVNNDDPSVKEMQRACMELLGPPDLMPTQNLSNAPSQSVLSSLDLGNMALHLKQGATEQETEDHASLMTLQDRFNVLITEFFREGKGGIRINGEPVQVGCAALEVEAMLCQAQEDFARSEEEDMQGDLEHMYVADDSGRRQQIERMSNRSYEKIQIDLDLNDRAVKEVLRKFEKCNLRILKLEKIENYALKQLFSFNRKRIQAQPPRLYQCVKAQFCNLICRVGFQREYAPPKEQKYGAGIYFTSEVDKARSLWADNGEEYIYFIEAQVLTGKDKRGSAELIVPPPIEKDPLVRYDSVTSGSGIHIIFNGQQAYPTYLITCSRQALF
ncbi:protein mono-ADP-ribosyltransferase PARP9 isoform X2 [Ictalurus punctatus]|uniref:Protein mono-ADP-ribosyltransferase PARP9 isoform X2 n=1 Tax=Ictalurus punctatus TaxID=7998 RepID=A0A9F7TPJ9_ICTPU|nr:protein mono-ADP-ribosyltransferase PARP9 isoform X2 [Ictalurus punctatus]